MEILVTFLFVIGMIVAYRLNARINELERRMQNSKPHFNQDTDTIPVHMNSVSIAASTPPSPPPYDSPISPSETREAPPRVVSREDPLTSWIKEDWQLKLGAFLLLLAAGWFVSYAVWENWIGITARIALGVIVGESIFVFGWWRTLRYRTQGAVFMLLGTTVTLLTTYAARELYGVFSPTEALLLMFVASLFVTGASVYFDSRRLSIVGLCLSASAPLFVNASAPDPIGLFSYLAVVVASGLGVVFWKGYRELTLTSVCIVGLYSMSIYSGATAEQLNTLLFFVYGFAVLFFVTNTTEILKRTGQNNTLDLITTALNAILLLSWIHGAAPVGFETIIVFVSAMLMLGTSFVVYTATGNRLAFYTYFGAATTYIAVATALQFTGDTLAIALTLEAAVIVLIAYHTTRDANSLGVVSLVFGVPIVASLPSLSALNPGARSLDATIILSVLAVTGLALCLYFRFMVVDSARVQIRKVSGGFFVLSVLYTTATCVSIWSDQSLTLVFIVEAIGVILATRILSGDLGTIKGSVVVLIVPIIASLSSLSALDPLSRSNPDTAVLLSLTVALYALCTYFKSTFGSADRELLRTTVGTLFVLGSLYAAATLASVWSDQSLALLLTIETIVVILATRYISGIGKMVRLSTFTFVLPAFLALPSIDPQRWITPINLDFAVLLGLSIALFAIGGYFKRYSIEEAERPQDRHAGTVLFIIGSIVAYILLWLTLGATFPNSPSTAIMIALTVYTVIGIFCSLYGTRSDSHILRVYGGTLVIAVVLRLFVVDVWLMSIVWRIVTFFVIGALLVSTAFLVRRKHIE